MSSFGSSVINKSTRKFAPKAPIRRLPPPSIAATPSDHSASHSTAISEHQTSRHPSPPRAPSPQAIGGVTEHQPSQFTTASPSATSSKERTDHEHHPAKRRRVEAEHPVPTLTAIANTTVPEVSGQPTNQPVQQETSDIIEFPPQAETQPLPPRIEVADLAKKRTSSTEHVLSQPVDVQAAPAQAERRHGKERENITENAVEEEATTQPFAENRHEEVHHDTRRNERTAENTEQPPFELQETQLDSYPITANARTEQQQQPELDETPLDSYPMTTDYGRSQRQPDGPLQEQVQAQNRDEEDSTLTTLASALISLGAERNATGEVVPQGTADNTTAPRKKVRMKYIKPRKSATAPKPKKPRQPRKKKGDQPIEEVPPETGTTVNDNTAEQPTEQDATTDTPALPAKPRKPRKPRKSKSTTVTANENGTPTTNLEDGAIAVDSAAGAGEQEVEERPRKRKRRAKTPEDAAENEVNTEEVTMFDLCSDSRQGRKSQRETDFQAIDWTEVVRQRKEAEQRARAGQGQEQDREQQEREREAIARQQEGGVRGPQLRIVNGQMVIDNDSLVVTRNQAGVRESATDAIEEESDLTKRLTSHSWIYANRRDPDERYSWAAKSDPWTDEQTDQFYDALRMFGTDFFIISKMFPAKSRRMIKMKFVREERSSPDRIRAALLGEQVPMDMATYCAATGTTEEDFKDPEQLERELREQDENQKADIERRKVELAEKAREKQEAAKARVEAGGRRKQTRGKNSRMNGIADGEGFEVIGGGGDGIAADVAAEA